MALTHLPMTVQEPLGCENGSVHFEVWDNSRIQSSTRTTIRTANKIWDQTMAELEGKHEGKFEGNKQASLKARSEAILLRSWAEAKSFIPESLRDGLLSILMEPPF